MATYTAQQLIQSGLRLATMPDLPTNSIVTHPSAAPGDAWDFLRAAIFELYDILLESNSETYSITKTPWTTVGGTADYAISTLAGATFYRFKGIDFFDNMRFVDLPRVNFADRNRYPVNGQPRGCAINGTNITIYPTPDAAYTMNIWFAPLPPTLANDTDTIDLFGPWEEFIVTRFARSCAIKDEADTRAFDEILYGSLPTRDGGLSGRIRQAAKQRDSAHPVAPVDVQQDDSYLPFTYPGRWL